MPRFTPENARTYGSRGGTRTYELYGTQHMQRIGTRGFWVNVIRHWDGDARAFVNYFIGLGLAATDPFPQNGAFVHDRLELRWRARYGMSSRLRRSWSPPAFPPDMEPPF